MTIAATDEALPSRHGGHGMRTVALATGIIVLLVVGVLPIWEYRQ